MASEQWPKLFHWKFSGVFIFFFWGGAFTMIGLSSSVDNPHPLLMLAFLFLLAGLVWSLGYWITCDFLREKKKDINSIQYRNIFFIWQYGIAILIIAFFIASAFLAQWIGTQIEIKNTKIEKILTAVGAIHPSTSQLPSQRLLTPPPTSSPVLPKVPKKEERPFFQISNPGIKPLSKSPPFRLMIPMENIGGHSAYDLEGKIIMIDQQFQSAPIILTLSVGNEILPNSPTPYFNDTLMLPSEQVPMYIVLAIKYCDFVIRKNIYSQVWYMQWTGVQHGTTNPDFVHVSVSQRNEIKTHLKTELHGFLK
jgi:hypothetical protein